VLILALGLNLVKLGEFKVANYLPALVFAPVFSWVFSVLPV
jgi:uncharacterized membrane protein YqgA involved in biofilm formation